MKGGPRFRHEKKFLSAARVAASRGCPHEMMIVLVFFLPITVYVWILCQLQGVQCSLAQCFRVPQLPL